MTLQSIGRKSVNDFTTDDVKKSAMWAQRFWGSIKEKSPFFRAWFGDWRAYDKTPVVVATHRDSSHNAVINDDTGWSVNVSGKVFNETTMHRGSANKAAVQYLPYIRDIVKNAVLLDTQVSKNGGQSLFMHTLYAIADIGNGAELLKLYVEELNDVNSVQDINRAYELRNIENWQFGVKGSMNNSNSPITQTANIKIVSQLFDAVKQRDSSFHPKPTNPDFLDTDTGMPKVFYHGTKDEFYFFDPTKQGENYDGYNAAGGAFDFTDSEQRARIWGAKAKGKGDIRVMPVYLRIAKTFYSYHGEVDPALEKYLPSNLTEAERVEAMNIGAVYHKVLEENGVDFVKAIRAEGYDSYAMYPGADNVSVYDAAQIKSATDNIRLIVAACPRC